MAEDTKKLRIFERVATAENGFEEVTTPASFSSPTVIVFGGLDVTTPEKANGLAKRAQIMLGRHECKDRDVRIFSAIYPWKEEEMVKSIEAYTARKTQEPDPTRTEAAKDIEADIRQQVKTLVRTQILPLIAREIEVQKDGTVTGKMRPLDFGMRAMRNINIMAHSFGTRMVEELGDVLATDLKSLGCTQAEADHLCKQVFLISTGDVAPIDCGHSAHFSTMHLINKSDYVVSAYQPSNGNISLTEQLLEKRKKNGLEPPLTIAPIGHENEPGDANRWLASIRDLPPVNRIKINGDRPQPADFSGHEFSSYALIGSPLITRPDMTGRQESEIERSNKFIDRLENGNMSNYLLVPIFVASLLRNAVNHSCQSVSAAETFTEIPSIQEMAKCHDLKTMSYTTNCTPVSEDYHRLHVAAKGIGYEERIQAAIHPEDLHRAYAGPHSHGH